MIVRSKNMEHFGGIDSDNHELQNMDRTLYATDLHQIICHRPRHSMLSLGSELAVKIRDSVIHLFPPFGYIQPFLRQAIKTMQSLPAADLYKMPLHRELQHIVELSRELPLLETNTIHHFDYRGFTFLAQTPAAHLVCVQEQNFGGLCDRADEVFLKKRRGLILVFVLHNIFPSEVALIIRGLAVLAKKDVNGFDQPLV